MNTSVHRLLDDAFAGLPASPDVQDLKEEIRANLLDRVAELTAAGTAPEEAARRAVDELGDVRALANETANETDETTGEAFGQDEGTAVTQRATSAATARHRPPVARRYVAGVVVAAVVVLLLALTPLAAVPMLQADGGDHDDAVLVLLLLVAPFLSVPAAGWIVAASLMRETATNYGMPRRRAVAYSAASALVVTALVAGLVGYGFFARASVVFQIAVPLLVAGGAWFAYLVATQTNRHKPWVLEQARAHAQVGNRFEENPATAARFGIYTIVLWSLVAAAFLVLGFTAGWLWALLAPLVGVAAFMLMLARMLFGSAQRNGRAVP